MSEIGVWNVIEKYNGVIVKIIIRYNELNIR